MASIELTEKSEVLIESTKKDKLELLVSFKSLIINSFIYRENTIKTVST
jgi:hypothetical protein